MEQSNNKNQSVEYSFTDIIKFFKGKVKTLIILTLVSGIIGGALGLALSALSAEYGTELSFRMTPADNSTQLIYLLNSESFAEKLLLEDNGLPKRDEISDKNAYDKADSAIQEYNKLRQQKKDIALKLNKISYELNIAAIDTEYAKLSGEYSRINNLLSTYKLISTESVATEDHIAKINQLEAQLEEALIKKQKYENEVYHPAHNEISLTENEYNLIRERCKEKQIEAEELSEIVLSEWRTNDNVKSLISIITRGVTYQYTEWSGSQDVKPTDAQALENRGFITVSVKLNCDKETADYIVSCIEENLPDLIEQSVETINNVSNVVCYSMSPYAESAFLSLGDMAKQTVTLALVAFVLVVGAYCSCVVLKNMFPISKETSLNDDNK